VVTIGNVGALLSSPSGIQECIGPLIVDSVSPRWN